MFPSLLQVFAKLGTYTELRTMSFIDSTGVACSGSVNHNQVQVLRIPDFFTCANIQIFFI